MIFISGYKDCTFFVNHLKSTSFKSNSTCINCLLIGEECHFVPEILQTVEHNSVTDPEHSSCTADTDTYIQICLPVWQIRLELNVSSHTLV